jgi:hypothetical protein
LIGRYAVHAGEDSDQGIRPVCSAKPRPHVGGKVFIPMQWSHFEPNTLAMLFADRKIK